MLGMIMTTFLDFLDERCSPDVTEAIIQECDLPSRGAYTSIGDYDHAELVAMLANVSERTKTAAPDLLRDFGAYAFAVFARGHADALAEVDDPFKLLENLDARIHRDVRKLYPNAQPPSFDCQRTGPQSIELSYRSSRKLADLAEGLIAGAFDHFGVPLNLERQDETHSEGQQFVRFFVTAADRAAA